jgi:hypothetical protein
VLDDDAIAAEAPGPAAEDAQAEAARAG